MSGRSVGHLIDGFDRDMLPSAPPTLADFEFFGLDGTIDSHGFKIGRKNVWFGCLKETFENLQHRHGISKNGFDPWRAAMRGDRTEHVHEIIEDARTAAINALHESVRFGGGGIYKLVQETYSWAVAQQQCELFVLGYSRLVMSPSWKRPSSLLPQPCPTCGGFPCECGSAKSSKAGSAGQPCYSCGRAASFKCSKCHDRRYCSRDCQRADWQAGHRRDCPGQKAQ